MKIWHFSDTHHYHNLLEVPKDIDIAIFSGDCSNPRDKYQNEQEVLNFLMWYGSIKARYKIFVAGNHDTSIESGFITKNNFDKYNIIYLENNDITISNGFEPIKIWGSPITPSFGQGWAYNMKRHKLYDLWQTIPEDTNIVVTHGPPKGILDLSYDLNGKMEFCGCNALANRLRIIQPKLHLFGHLHRMEGINNAGYIKYSDHNTIYSNGSVVTDGKFGKLSSHGNIFNI